MNTLYEIFGGILGFIYNNLTPGFYKYAITILIFTLFVKILLLPIAIKQQKSMVDMQKIQPKLNEIRAKYKNDMQKMNEETMKLYSEHKVNPMGGCLPAFIQIPIFIALYGVITQPITYIFKFTSDQTNALFYSLNYLYPPGMNSQIQMVEKSQELFNTSGPDALSVIANKIQSLSNFNYLNDLLTSFHSSVTDAVYLIQRASTLSVDFLGLNLAQFPKEHMFSPLIIIPILAAVTTYLSSKMMTNMQAASADVDPTIQSTQKSMIVVMPFMTLFITFTLPAGLGLYWLISNVFQMIQQYFLNKYIKREDAVK